MCQIVEVTNPNPFRSMSDEKRSSPSVHEEKNATRYSLRIKKIWKSKWLLKLAKRKPSRGGRGIEKWSNERAFANMTLVRRTRRPKNTATQRSSDTKTPTQPPYDFHIFFIRRLSMRHDESDTQW